MTHHKRADEVQEIYDNEHESVMIKEEQNSIRIELPVNDSPVSDIQLYANIKYEIFALHFLTLLLFQRNFVHNNNRIFCMCYTWN